MSVHALRSAAAVRERCAAIFRAGLDDQLQAFRVDLDALPNVADEVVAEIERTYPQGPIPIHGRLNHLRGAAHDLTTDLHERLGPSRLDFVIASVLVDAGAGPSWRFVDEDLGSVNRSEGLAVASHRALADGCFGGGTPWAIDPTGLQSVDHGTFAAAFQVTKDNPLVGVEGRVQLLRQLGTIQAAAGGSTWSMLRAEIDRGRIAAADLLRWVLTELSDLWPGRLEVDGTNLGDTWRHPAAGGSGSTEGLVPFHKLSQWMTYSLVEPLAALDVEVVDLDALTGLAEYRNGGMLLELGMITPKTGELPSTPLAPDDLLVVEWRALTVAALDLVAEAVRDRLPPERALLPLGALLEAGTWPLGRRLAYDRTPDGTPPIEIRSDGTVF